MTKIKIPKILDCTLRDGGYVNNWEFDTATALAIINGLYESGIRYIEVGILGSNGVPGKQTKFNCFEEIEPLLQDRKLDCHYAVMFTQENAQNIEFPIASEKTPDCIRLAYFKKTWREAFEQAAELKQKGYQVFLQAMATFMYSRKELEEMILAVNAFQPAAFYMVDSFSTMYPHEVSEMRDYVLSVLDPSVAFGFHAHNNIQMAFANVQEFIHCDINRDLFVDSSIFGMGRGAGNAPTELVMEYLNKQGHQNYKISQILNLYERYLDPIYKQYSWGYSLPYYLTASKEINSAYGWFFMSHGINCLDTLEKALDHIPQEWNYALNKETALKIIEDLQQ